MPNMDIEIRGAREHNLKNVNVSIPRNSIVVFVGVSGSGKSTLAFDIIAREGQRQYLESVSTFSRRFLQKSNRPDVDSIQGISSTIIINQDRVHKSPRSTVGTLTQAYSYLRLLYSRVGLPSFDSNHFSFNHPYGACPQCKGLGNVINVDIHQLLDFEKSLHGGAIRHSDWRVGGMRWNIIRSTHFFDMDKKISDYSREELERLLYAPKQIVADESEIKVIKWTYSGLVTYIMGRDTSVHRGPTETDLKFFDSVPCNKCNGQRLNEESLSVRIQGLTIGEVGNLSLEECRHFIRRVNHKYAEVIKPHLILQLEALIDVGIGYLSLNRSTDTLSGGEAQRVKIARQLGSDLVETIYVLDEPTAGLHPRDVGMVIANLHKLKSASNTVIVVEHDESIIRSADYVVEVGPEGGRNGGSVVFTGSVEDLINCNNSHTSPYIKNHTGGGSKIYRNAVGSIVIKNASLNNLKDITVTIPTGVLLALTGVSGAGKSSFVEELVKQFPEKTVLIDQGSIGTNRRGCIATYIGAFDIIRNLFSKASGVSSQLFSFNSHGGCDECNGLGYIDMEMNFLGDVKIKCDLCKGSRYKEKVLRYTLKGKTIVDILNMTALEVIQHVNNDEITSAMQLLIDVGLDYINVGQTLDTLSGGERQRLKLATKLQSKGEFYILDEPTSGLHFADIEKLLKLLNKLVDNGNTVLIIEHNLTIISNSDWVIDLGPEGGERGGEVVAAGTPRQVSKNKKSITGRFLKGYVT